MSILKLLFAIMCIMSVVYADDDDDDDDDDDYYKGNKYGCGRKHKGGCGKKKIPCGGTCGRNSKGGGGCGGGRQCGGGGGGGRKCGGGGGCGGGSYPPPAMPYPIMPYPWFDPPTANADASQISEATSDGGSTYTNGNSFTQADATYEGSSSISATQGHSKAVGKHLFPHFPCGPHPCAY